jgi:chemotaxis protein MotB
MRKKKHPEHVNHERWLVSYADFMTLLFAFFVVMFSVSQVDSKAVGRFTESFSTAVGIPVGGAFGRGVLPGAATASPEITKGASEPPAESSEIGEVESKLRAKSGGQELEAVTILRIGNELVLRFAEAVTFGSGDATLKEAGVRALHAIAEALRGRRVSVRVEGHTDNIPISTARFRSNWDLSTARATTVVAELIGPGRMDPRRLAAAGYAEYHPLTANATIEQRSQNRRVDIVISEVHEVDAGAPPSP